MSTGDWITDGQTGKQYLVLDTDDLVYDVIQQVCHNHGGFLPEPREEEENSFLDSLDTDTFALGMTDRKVEGQWIWDSDGSPVIGMNWIEWSSGVNEPNGGTNQNCALMIRQAEIHEGGHIPDGWADYPCNSSDNLRSLPKNLICQRNPGMWTDLASHVLCIVWMVFTNKPCL